MILLILGVLLWSAAHLFKRLAPAARARMGDSGRGVVALGSLAGLVLMIWGYRISDTVPVYTPLPGMGHLNNLLMLVSVFLFAMANMNGKTAGLIRHKMLTGVLVWVVAHLLVNGDVASLILFGGMGAWAIVEMLLINRAGPWEKPTGTAVKYDLMGAAGSVVVFAVIAGIHIWLGYNPFLGTYG